MIEIDLSHFPFKRFVVLYSSISISRKSLVLFDFVNGSRGNAILTLLIQYGPLGTVATNSHIVRPNSISDQ